MIDKDILASAEAWVNQDSDTVYAALPAYDVSGANLVVTANAVWPLGASSWEHASAYSIYVTAMRVGGQRQAINFGDKQIDMGGGFAIAADFGSVSKAHWIGGASASFSASTRPSVDLEFVVKRLANAGTPAVALCPPLYEPAVPAVAAEYSAPMLAPVRRGGTT